MQATSNNSLINLVLNTTPEQHAHLAQLQTEFASACNLVAPVAQAQRCWNRVALHHLVYRVLREKYPQLGSQMACNVVYSVARTYRLLLTHPQSPLSQGRASSQPLPNVRFSSNAPVYFDRHTLSVRNKSLSLFSLNGRLRFELNVTDDIARKFSEDRLREIVLRRHGEKFALQFQFIVNAGSQPAMTDDNLPEYVVITEPDPITPAANAPATAELA